MVACMAVGNTVSSSGVNVLPIGHLTSIPDMTVREGMWWGKRKELDRAARSMQVGEVIYQGVRLHEYVQPSGDLREEKRR